MRKRSRIKQRTERRISAFTSLTMCAVVVLVQIASTLLLTVFLHEYASIFYAALELLGAVVAIRIYTRSGSPSYKLVWMCLLLALPVAGMILFFLWGGTHQAKTLSLKKVAPPAEGEGARRQSEACIARLRRIDPAWSRLASYLQKRDFLLYPNTNARYFGDGAICRPSESNKNTFTRFAEDCSNKNSFPIVSPLFCFFSTSLFTLFPADTVSSAAERA